MKRFLITLLLCAIPLAYANECQIKPILKEYKQTKVENSIKNIITKEGKETISIDTPKPEIMRPNLSSMYIYNRKPLKSILFFKDNSEVQGYQAKELNLKAFGVLDVDKKESPIFAYRYDWITCENLPIQLKLDSDEYKVFFLKGYSNNLFIIPKNDNDKNIYVVQFAGFQMDEINNILGTLKIEKE